MFTNDKLNYNHNGDVTFIRVMASQITTNATVLATRVGSSWEQNYTEALAVVPL